MQNVMLATPPGEFQCCWCWHEVSFWRSDDSNSRSHIATKYSSKTDKVTSMLSLMRGLHTHV